MYTKIVQSGDLIEVYKFVEIPEDFFIRKPIEYAEKDPLSDDFDALPSFPKGRTYNPPTKRTSSNLTRAKKSFRRLVFSNLQKGNANLLTLTMLDIVPLATANREFTAFGQRLKRLFGKHVSWIAVAEFQRRGAVHYHALVWGLPDIGCILGDIYYDKTGKKHRKHVCPNERPCERRTRRLAALWESGFVDCIKTDNSPKLASYLSKYMSKSMSDVRLFGSKAYCASRNLLRSVSFSGQAASETAFRMWGLGRSKPCLTSFSYDTLFLGRCEFETYSLGLKNEKSTN